MGWNWQFNQVVFGLEGDGSYTQIQGSTTGTGTPGGCFGAVCSSNLQTLGTFRGRLGLAWDNIMPFVTGGLAVGSLNGSEGVTGTAGGSGTTTLVGWTAGGGIEVKFLRNWSLKAEYLYVDLGNQTIFNDTLPGGAVLGEKIRSTTSIFRGGLNYYFDWGRY
jgi:outer membrane immunogenic protein